MRRVVLRRRSAGLTNKARVNFDGVSMQLDLIRITNDLFAAMASCEQLRERFDVGATSDQVASLREVVRQSLDHQAKVAVVPPWIGYLACDADRTVVGCCGFKGNPFDARVEIAYGTLPEFEGLGIGSAMAKCLVDIAIESRHVKVVLAHTLPERNGSCRILEKNGFENVGEVDDPEDGPVWQWQLRLLT